MKLTVFGAAGGTGKRVVEESLAAGHEVTVLVRDPITTARSARSWPAISTGRSPVAWG
jgi:uncharacterized protein YbjT (DUF2867 family)